MPATLGPVSAVLEADLRDWVRKRGVVLWLDVDNHYSDFVNNLRKLRASGNVPYEVQAFRGSHLELMLALETLTGGIDRPSLLIHLPGFTEEAVHASPLLELYIAGIRYRKALPTLVTEAAAGRVRPEQIAAFLEQGELTLDAADAWLAAILDDRDGGLSAHLRAMSLAAVIDDLLTGGFVAGQVKSPTGQDAVWDRLTAGTGLAAAWRDACLPSGSLRAEDMAFAAASWALCVEYVDDLRRSPIEPRLQGIRELPRRVREACRELADHLRDRQPAFYQRTADETEAWLTEEIDAAQAEELGTSDTFRFEEDAILKAALKALSERRWDAAHDWSHGRVDGNSFWLRGDLQRHSAWELISAAAHLGQALDAAGPSLGSPAGLEAAVEQYRERGAIVDQLHRHLEQRRLTLLYPEIPEFETLRNCLDGLRKLWRDWADTWARDFNRVCVEHGFLPPASLQQRTLFDDVVRPMTKESGTTALFVVDALRYEMGEELYRALADTPATTTHLRARLAELPTVTEVGMNVLAPVVASGRLRPALSDGTVAGFSTGEFRVYDPDSRKRAMHDRVGGSTCPWLSLEEVLTRDATSLKQAVARARLLIVHSREIDDAGEKGAGPAVFDHVMQKLRAAWRLLRDAGVRRFVFTADHGFLLLDETTRAPQTHGRKSDPKPRYVWSTVAEDHAGEVRVAMADLGYEGADGYLMFAESTAVYETGRRSLGFAHGGNSLQERVIPVLTLSHRAAAGGTALQYILTATAREGVAGLHCMEAKAAVQSQLGLDFGGPRDIELGLRVAGAADVQVELCQTRGGARLEAGAIMATVGESFELFFRLSGTADARVLVELYHPGAEADLAPFAVDTRFAVAVTRPAAQEPTVVGTVEQRLDWLEQLPDDGVRRVFQQLASHGEVTETEAAAMLGGQRALRRFSMRFEELAKKVPFSVRIDAVGGVKRYVVEK
ncbi:MAG: BREX-6 system phosphatase PglZ [Planctomycetota bacterium]|nr:BREX-6 system phosphatase PglZ [Planctomycetota bacterium]